MNQQYPDKYPKGSGALFTNSDKTSENHPDFRGNIELTGDQIRKLIEMAKAGLEPKLQVAGWWRQAKQSGQTYMSLSTEAYMKDAEAQQYPQVPQPQYRPPQPQYQPPQPQMQPQQVPQPQVPPQVPPQPQGDTFIDDDIPFN